MITEHNFADFSGGLNLSADVSKIPDRECILAENCIFDEIGNVQATGGSTKQNSSALTDAGNTNVHSLYINPTMRHVALVGNDSFSGTALSGLAIRDDEVNASQEKTAFENWRNKIFFDGSGTPRVVRTDAVSFAVDWAAPIGSSASSGPSSPATAANDTANGGTEAWVNPNNCFSSNDTRATVALTTGQTSQLLKATNFSFAIPSGATIVGIVVEIEKSSDTVGSVLADADVRLVKASVPVGDDKANVASWPSADAYSTYGSSTDLWGTTWTPAEVNASTFGAAIAAYPTTTTSETARVDHIRITIYYYGAALVPAVGVSGNPNGTYTYKLTFEDEDGNESDASLASASVAPASQSVNLTGVALGDTRTTKRNIYRKGGNLTFYYWVGEIADNTSTTFSDNISDTEALTTGIILAGEIEGDRANTRIGASVDYKYPCLHYERMFWADQSSGNTNRIVWSKPSHPYAYPSAFAIFVGDDKPVTRIVTFLNDLIIFKEDSIWRLTGSEENSFQLSRTPATVGCNMPFTVVKLQDRIMFANSQGIWFFDGVTARPVTNRLDHFFNGRTINSIAPIVVNSTTKLLAERL